MIRESLAVELLLLTPSDGEAFRWRTATGGVAFHASSLGLIAWLGKIDFSNPFDHPNSNFNHQQ
jgi:hypothetical protein